MANVTKKGLGGLSVSVLILGVLALGGCDFVRRVAGRPTGAEIAQKRELIRAKEQAAAAAQEAAHAAQAAQEAP
ncbi:MAG: hypothetical protein J6T07_04785, partial [Bacteroidales bacterium]|nr:hypothetical protein [Bacteroidales bacterium]